MRVPRMAGMLLLLGIPAVAAAQSVRDDMAPDGLVLRVNGPVSVPPGERVGTLVIVSGDAVIDGTVRDLIVLGGTARVAGEVRDGIVVARGHLEVANGGVVGGDVLLYGSTMAASPRATVIGAVHDEPGFSFSARASWLLWLSVTIVCVVGGLLFAAFAGRQLVEGVRTMAFDPGETAIGAAIMMAALPAAAMLAFVTVIGIPLGFAILFMVLPTIAFLGYVVSGTVLGAALIRRRDGWRSAGGTLYAEAAVGLFALQLVSVVPGIGGLIAILASLAGAGALAVRSWRTLRPANGMVAERERQPVAQPA